MRISDWSSDVCSSDLGCTVVIGINERDPVSVGTLYNTNLIIGADGGLLGRHRKLVPTWAEKLTWAGGDDSSIRVYDTPVGPLGTLACGENTNTLARFALLSQGELVHVANYIALPVAPASYNMARSEEHTSELQSLMRISYAVFCLKKKK